MMKLLLFKISLLLTIAFFCTVGNNGYAQANPTVRIIPMGNNQCVIPDRQFAGIAVKACRGNTVTYEAIGNNITQYRWTVTGGTFTLSAGQDQCVVTWGDGDMGIVDVEATTTNNSTCTDRLVVVLEDKPECHSITRPAYITNPPDYDEKVIYVCMGDSLVFIDNSISTTTPIVSYYWHSPWGTSTNTTFSFVAHTMGSYNVEHRVYNECGCYDEETIKLIVGERCSLELNCYGAVCANSRADYIVTNPTCTNYFWDVEGGILVAGQGASSISVVWGEPESGYGILTLDGAQCNCSCKSPKSIKVPVISDAVSITGNEVVCMDQNVTYSLPLWGGTAYWWEVSPMTGVTIGAGDSTNELVLRFSTTGTYNITAHYQCRFLECGPFSDTKTVHVKDRLSITSPQSDVVCKDVPVTFSTNATTGSIWSITKGGNTVFESLTPTTTLTYTFADDGIYTITAENADYCNHATKIVEVPLPPPKPRNVTGPGEVCPGYSQYYSATSDGPDYIIEWTWWMGGSDSATCTGDHVMITFGSQVSDISVRQVDRRTGCRSAAVRKEVRPYSFDPWPYAGSLIKVCQGQTFELDRLTPSDATVLYEWTVVPTYAASVIGDHTKPNVSVLANYSYNMPESVAMVLWRRACGIEQYDTAWVRIGEIEPPEIEFPTPYCAHVEDQLTMTATSDWANVDRLHSHWELSNGVSSFQVNGLPGSVVFPAGGTYQVVLYYVAQQGCTVACTNHVEVRDFPLFYFEENGGYLCVMGGDPNVTYNYGWSTGAQNIPCIPTPTGSVTCFVCDIENVCCTTLKWEMPSHDVCNPTPNAFTASPICFNIMEIGVSPSVTLPATLAFLCGTNVVGVTQLTHPNQHVLVPQHCVDNLRLTWRVSGVAYCDEVTIEPITGNMLDFSVASDCNGHIVVTDNTQYPSPPYAIPPRVAEAIPSGSLSGYQVAFPADGTVAKVPVLGTITEPTSFMVRVYVGSAPGCYIEYERTFDPMPRILSVNFPNPMCEDIPKAFSAVAVGCDLEYQWFFNDGSYNFGNEIYHTYDPGTHPTSLKVTDCHGCEVTMGGSITVNDNPIAEGSIEGYPPDCYGQAMQLNYHEAILGATHLWTPTSFTQPTINVYAGGDYIVLEELPTLGCRRETSGNTRYPNEIIAQIRCQGSYCEGDEITAMGYAGDQYQYGWELRDQYNTLVGLSNDANYTFTSPAAGDYRLILEVSENNCSERCTTQFTVHQRPTTPSIAFDGNACIDQGPVLLRSTDDSPLMWSNGDYGTNTTYYTSGHVSAYYVDANGCLSYPVSIDIPFLPNFDGLLTGCYGICPEDKPYMSVYTLGPVVGASYKWMWNGSSMVPAPATVPLPPMTITLPTYGPGVYQLEITNGGCTAQSPILTLDELNCNSLLPGNQSLSCKPMIKSCSAEGCSVKYTASVTVCNRMSSSLTVAGMNSITGPSVSVSTTLPQVLPPDDCMTMDFTFYYDFTTPSAMLFSVYDMAWNEVGQFALSLADCIECLDPDECNFDVKMLQLTNTTYSILDQVIYFDMTFTPTSSDAQILAIWCTDGGEMVSGSGGNPYYGLFSISFGQLTQLVESGKPFCFYVLCCVKDMMPCLKQICLKPDEVEGLYGDVLQSLSKHNARNREEPNEHSMQQHYRLVPNPTMGKVCVVEAETGAMATDVGEVEVLSQAGQMLLRHRGGGWIDLSSLPTGSYMVRIYGTRKIDNHKLVVKRR